jgi:small-conductance mechanosensitive channel
MNLKEFLENILFSIGDFNITLGNVVLTTFVLLLLFAIQRLIQRRWLPRFIEGQEMEEQEKRKIQRTVSICFVLLYIIVLSLGSGVNPELFATEAYQFRLSGIFGILLVWQLARLTDQMLSRILTRNFNRRRRELSEAQKRLQLPSQTKVYNKRGVQYVVYLIAAFVLVHTFKVNYTFTIPLGKEPLSISLSDIIIAITILMVARLLIWVLIQLILYPYYRRKEINIGSQYAINQLIRYVLFFIAFMIALQFLGIQMTIIWGGAAALLVGVGLGLQQTFNDFFSGLVLLFERSVEVGDVVNVGGLIGTVRRIGMRASHIQTRDNITVIVPNSKLVIDNVVNWSHNDNRARFYVKVGVAYGSDTDLVRTLLIEVAQQHEKVLNFPKPFVRFTDFGNSSLEFEVHFWTVEFIRIEDVKSDIRFAIDQAFRENNVTIPFPQRDVWIKNPMPQENGQAPQAEKP